MNHDAPKPLNSQLGTYEKVVGLLPPGRGARILDVGAGEGFFCRRLHELGYRVDACDIEPRAFRCPEVPFTRVDLNAPLPIANEQYDCVVSIEVIEHVENHFLFLRELLRVTKPGGRVIVTTPNVLSLPARWYTFLYGYSECSPLPLDAGLDDWHMEHVNPIGVPQLLAIFERYGAELEVLTTNRLRRSSWLPMILLYPLLAVAIRLRFLRRKHAGRHALHRRHIRWMLHPANLMGRITVAVARKRLVVDRRGPTPAEPEPSEVAVPCSGGTA